MKANLTKKILITAELASSPVGAFFQELGLELSHNYVEGHVYEFAVDDACPEVLTVARLQISDDLDFKYLPFVHARISKNLFENPEGRKLLISHFNDSEDFDLVDRYSKEMKDIYTVKIHDYLNMGFFIDSIVVEAYKAKFDIIKLRNYLNAALNFSFKKTESGEDEMPIDVSYSHNGSAFTVQITLTAMSFEAKKELQSILPDLINNSHYFDTTYFHKKNQLTLSSLIFQDPSLKTAQSYFFTEITKRAIDSVLEDAEVEIHSGLVARDDVNYESQKVTYDEQSKKLAIARKFALFIKSYRGQEENPKNIEVFEVSDVDHYLSFYPRQKALEEIDDEIKSFLIKLLKDEQLFSGISQYVEKVASSNLDSQFQEIQKILGGKSLADIEEILMVRGSRDNGEDSEVLRVKGWLGSLDEKQVVSGSEAGMSDNEIWEVRKGQLNAKIQNEFIRVKSEGRNIIQDDIVRVVAKELDATEKDIKVVVSGIVEEVVSSELVKNQKLEEAFALQILSQQTPDQVKEKLESQIGRMKKIMEQMKRELVRLQNEKTVRDAEVEKITSAPTESPELLQMKAVLGRSLAALKIKEKFIEKIKNDFEINLKFKDQAILSLQEKVTEVKEEFARSRELANEERLKTLEAENKTLIARLEISKKKVVTINDNIEAREIEFAEKLSELDTLKSNLHLANTMIEHLKQEKTQLQSRLHDEKPKKMGNDREFNAARSEISEKDVIIHTLNSEKKSQEEKYRAQAIELKKVEQKLKYSISQLESAQKKNAVASGQKSAEAHIRQLEQANARLNEMTSEVSEKRKEIVKLKQENGLMSSKISELERKLILLEKKAA